MKNLCTILAALSLSYAAFAQTPELTPVKVNPVTPVKDQGNTPTCWAFSTLSLLESEAIRLRQLDSASWPDFSEMFVVEKSFEDRAVKEHILGSRPRTANPGSESDDVLHVIADYGLVPEGAMKSLQDEEEAREQEVVRMAISTRGSSPICVFPICFSFCAVTNI